MVRRLLTREGNRRRYRNPTKPSSHEYIPVLILHLLVGAGIGMLASASSAFDPTSHGAASNLVLLKVGIATLEVVWVVLCVWTIWSLIARKRRDAPGWRGGSLVSFSITYDSLEGADVDGVVVVRDIACVAVHWY